ncbi:MAG: DNA topoisomerase IV subunit A, partial [Chitinophagia bacterium]|nr:DNA topoisomerase IV subunit A [Chitinophagia bacterium]
LLRKLVKKEIEEDRLQFGDERLSPIVARESSQALKEEDILPNEAITVVLSQNGWVRAAKGLEINGQELSYKSGDEFRAQTTARTNQQVVFFDSEGKVYSLPGHVLPSARGQGEPLTGKLNPADDATFCALIGGEPEDLVIIAQDRGYGFMTDLQSLYVKSRNGKSCLKLIENSSILPPRIIKASDEQKIALVTNVGRLLIFASQELPSLARGKGNKLINLSKEKPGVLAEKVVDVQVITAENQLTVHAGKRHFTLKAADLERYYGSRGRRGQLLPRGLQNVTSLEVS